MVYQTGCGRAGSASAEQIRGRLEALLVPAPEEPAAAHTARGWVDRAYEAAYGENYAIAVESAQRGLTAAGSDDPENRLMLLRILSGVHEIQGDSASAAPYLAQRIHLLRDLGRHQQANVEEQLGGILLREPDRVEGEILRRLADELDTHPPRVERADVLSSLAVRTLYDEGPETAIPLLEQTCDILSALGREETLAGSKMFLAHTQLLAEKYSDALATADEVMSAPANRAIRGAMAMLRATVHHSLDNDDDAILDAIHSTELYAGCGVRRGAASAAALLAGLSASLERHEVAVLAWRVAVQQAELGEFDESMMLTLALGQQLLEMDEYNQAEDVLDSLVERSSASSDHHLIKARALMGLGHAVTHLKRPLEAMHHWDEAAGLFHQAQDMEEARRAHLAAGALAASLDRVQTARHHYERGLALATTADDVDPLTNLQALHSLGHLLCRHGDETGLEHLDQALSIATDHGSLWQRADIVDTQARSLAALARRPEAVATALSAADLFDDAEDTEAGADAEIFAASVLYDLNQVEESETLFRHAIEHREVPSVIKISALEGQADALRYLGKTEQADRVEDEIVTMKAELATAEEPGSEQ